MKDQEFENLLRRRKVNNKIKEAILYITIIIGIAFFLLSCTVPTVEVPQVTKTLNCDSCHQAQYLIYQSSATSYDTLMIWSTDTITADSLTSLYSWFNCGMDTTIFDADSIIFNQMKCN